MGWSIDRHNNRLWYDEHGSGTPLVLLHGWCMSSAVWFRQLEVLSGSCRVITIDLPGHGKSPARSDGFSLSGCTAGLQALFEQLDLREVLLAGWSLGSIVALAASGGLRDRLSGLALISGTPCFTRRDDFSGGLTVKEVDGMALKVRRSLRRALDGFVSRMFVTGELDDRESAERIAECLSGVPLPEPDTALQSLDVLAEADLRGSLAAIDLPVLVINGDCDVICLPEASEFLVRSIAGAAHVVFEGCGHAPFLTQPGRFNTCLEGFRSMVVNGEY